MECAFIVIEMINFDVNEAEAILLGFQHYLVMLGTTVLIPSSLVTQMGGGNVSLDKKERVKSKWF